MRNLDNDKKEITRLINVFPKDKTLGMAELAIDRAITSESKVKLAENAFAEIRNLIYNGVNPMPDIDQIALKTIETLKDW